MLLPKFDPIFLEGPDGDVIASDWAGGFLHAVALRADTWIALLDDDDAWKLMVPFQLLNGDLEFDDDSAEDEFLTERPLRSAFVNYHIRNHRETVTDIMAILHLTEQTA